MSGSKALLGQLVPDGEYHSVLFNFPHLCYAKTPWEAANMFIDPIAGNSPSECNDYFQYVNNLQADVIALRIN